jgi:hypothetical protein
MPPVGISFRRHAQKTNNGKNITEKGKDDTIKLAREYKPAKIYSSTENRTIETAKILEKLTNTEYKLRIIKELRGHKYFSGEIIRNNKRDNLLTFFKRVSEKLGVKDSLVIKIWLNGQFPKKIVPKPEVIADQIIKDRFKLPNRVNKITERTILFENITHDVVIAALFQRLAAEKYYKRFKELPKELEALRIDITKESKATMTFRDYKKEITERLNAILTG